MPGCSNYFYFLDQKESHPCTIARLVLTEAARKSTVLGASEAEEKAESAAIGH